MLGAERGNRTQGKSDVREGSQDLCVKAVVDVWKIKNDCPACVCIYMCTVIIKKTKNQERSGCF
jgi:hypothetical protein